MEEEIVKEIALVEGSVSDAHAYEAQRAELQQKHHERRLEFQKKQHEVVIEFEMDLQAEREKLMGSFQMKWLSWGVAYGKQSQYFLWPISIHLGTVKCGFESYCHAWAELTL